MSDPRQRIARRGAALRRLAGRLVAPLPAAVTKALAIRDPGRLAAVDLPLADVDPFGFAVAEPAQQPDDRRARTRARTVSPSAPSPRRCTGPRARITA